MSSHETVELLDFSSGLVGHDSGISSFSSDYSDSVYPSSFLLDSGQIGTSFDIKDLLTSSENEASFQVSFLGEYQLSRRHTPAMIPWVVQGVCCKNECDQITMTITRQSDYSALIIKTHLNQNGRLFFDCKRKRVQLEHSIKNITRFSKCPQNPRIFSYLFRHSSDLVFTCYVYEANDEEVVNNIFYTIRDSMLTTTRTVTGPPSPPFMASQCIYDVFYIGKVVVATRKAPPTFVDEAVKKFEELARPTSVESHLRTNDLEPIQEAQDESTASSQHFGNINACSKRTSVENSKVCSTREINVSEDEELTSHKMTNDSGVRDKRPSPVVQLLAVGRSASMEKGCAVHLQIGQEEISLLSYEHKHSIKEWKFKDISFCSQGIICCNHFGFIARSAGSSNYVCYIFKCSSEALVDEMMLTMKKAFQSSFEKSSRSLVVCELCPLNQLHKLCLFIENMEPEKIFNVLSDRLQYLTKLCEIEPNTNERTTYDVRTLLESNICLMNRLLKLCEKQQQFHEHINDNKRPNKKLNDFLMFPTKKETEEEIVKQQPLGMSSMEDLNGNETNLDRLQVDKWANEVRQRRHSVPHSLPISAKLHEVTSSPLCKLPVRKDQALLTNQDVSNVVFMDKLVPEDSPIRSMFLKVGNTSRVKVKPNLRVQGRSNSLTSSSSSSSSSSSPLLAAVNSQLLLKHTGAWQISILSSLRLSNIDDDEYCNVSRDTERSFHARSTWKKAIGDTLLLIKINKKNQERTNEEEREGVGSRVNYQEVTPCLREVTKIWKQLLDSELWKSMKLDYELLAKSVRDGVPKELRGRVWKLLVHQNRMHNSNSNNKSCSSAIDDSFNCDAVDYEILKRQLTSHQHAILIDLGRTYPGHPYFATPSGPGQAALFNILKAYSVLDVEVGYCQGLSFVAGALLIHVNEKDAFEILKHIMFRLGFRRQYKPDMVPLQIRMYQLTRMLHDSYRDLYEHLEEHQIAPTLYAAPWFLTIFASQFPLGFVGRVFDLIFTFGTEVVLKVALILLGNHKELIKQCCTFESIVDFLKTTLPDMAIIQMERIFNQVFQLDITKTLEAYEVEYHILHEEMGSCSSRTPPSCDAPEKDKLLMKLSRVQLANDSLRRQKMELLEQLQTARRQISILEAENSSLSSSEVKLRSQNQILELERAALLNTIEKLRKPAFIDCRCKSGGDDNGDLKVNSENDNNNAINMVHNGDHVKDKTSNVFNSESLSLVK